MNSAYETLRGPPFHPKKPYKTYLYAGGTIAIIPRRARLLYYYTCRLPFLARTILAGSVCAHTRHACKLKRTVEHGYTSDFLQLFVNSKSFVLENFWEAEGGWVLFSHSFLFHLFCAVFISLRYIYIFFGHFSNVTLSNFVGTCFLFIRSGVWKFKECFSCFLLDELWKILSKV